MHGWCVGFGNCVWGQAFSQSVRRCGTGRTRSPPHSARLIRSATLLDYATTKAAIVAFTKALAKQVIERGIRVNAVAPGPIWTPLIPASFTPKRVTEFGSDTLMERPGQPAEVAPAYVFLASADGSYITGQVIHINGGTHIAG